MQIHMCNGTGADGVGFTANTLATLHLPGLLCRPRQSLCKQTQNRTPGEWNYTIECQGKYNTRKLFPYAQEKWKNVKEKSGGGVVRR